MRTKPFTIYKISLHDAVEGSLGFRFETSRTAAENFARTWEKDGGEFDNERSTEIQAINVVPTKGGIVYALETNAAHPDNG
jgi:hypothetical protein